jgi:tRNA isopentenyl-2-thiomethyl-A-37 hydroxylase MiaE
MDDWHRVVCHVSLIRSSLVRGSRQKELILLLDQATCCAAAPQHNRTLAASPSSERQHVGTMVGLAKQRLHKPVR